MSFSLAVIADAHKEEVVGVLCNVGWIFFTLNLAYSGINIPIKLQFQHDSGGVNMFSWNKHNVSKTLSRWQFTNHHIIDTGIIVGYGEYTGKRIYFA